jgi:anti-sigma regulatory factor (Ser/Thr protein kinase)
MKPCGRGLFLMRKLLDEVSYNERGNEVTLVLRLESGGGLEGGIPA